MNVIRNRNMSTPIVSLLALAASITIFGTIMATQEDIFFISVYCIAAMLGAGMTVYFRPEPTVSKAFIKTMWSSSFGVLLGWGINDIVEFQKLSFKVLTYSGGGLSAIFIIEGLVKALEKGAPKLIETVVEKSSDKLVSILGGGSAVKLTEVKTTEVMIEPNKPATTSEETITEIKQIELSSNNDLKEKK